MPGRKPLPERNRDEIAAYVAAHPEPCRITPAELMAATGMARATLYRAFKPDGGVIVYLTSVRLTAARALLAEGLTFDEVSRRCGFDSPDQLQRGLEVRPA